MTKRASRQNWVEIDKRIRGRRFHWTAAELKELEHDLAALPDLAERADPIPILQPTLVNRSQPDWVTGDTAN